MTVVLSVRGWVGSVSVFHPNVGDLQLRLLKQYSGTSVTRDQGEKLQRKHFVLHQQRIWSWLPPSEEAALVKRRERRLKRPCDGF